MMDEDRFIELLDNALDKRARIDAKLHGAHHDFVQRWIEKEKIKAERWEEIKRQVFGWGLIAIIGAIGTVVAKKAGIQI
ncbi:MAG: hypothetical protein RL563_1092 [Pseudomonadota bacterium]|jgi:hypothetical protein